MSNILKLIYLVSLILYSLCTDCSELEKVEQIKNILRPSDVPEQGLLCDLLWSDPDEASEGYGANDRGVSVTFGPKVVEEFLKKNDLDLICRAHQHPHRNCSAHIWCS